MTAVPSWVISKGMPPMSTPTTLVADRYRLVKLIGTGGMGVVWHAHDERLQRAVALKMLRTQPELTDEEREVTTARAMREARLTAALHHPHAVQVFDVVEHEGQPCLVMQLIESTPLSTLLEEHGTLTPRETARIGAQVGAALAAAHRLRIVHRDVKPGNILIREDGAALISDFGIAHALGDAAITATGMVHGTPAYLAPEVARGEPSSFASDVFSLGSTLYAMLEGAPPFGSDRNAIALLHRVARGEHPAPQHAGPLEPLLLEMLSADPKRRPDMTTVAARLSEAEQDLPDGASPTIPIGGAAVAAAALAGGDAPTEPAATRVIGSTAETERLGEAPAETDRAGASASEDAPPLADTGAPESPAPLFPWLAEPQPSAEPPESPPPGPDAAPRRGRRTAALIGVLVAVGLLVVGGVLLVGLFQQDGGTVAGPEAEETPQSAETTAPESTSAAESTPPAAEPSTAPPPAETEPPPPSAEQRAVDTLVSYYSVMPGDLDAAWPMMTADYQVNHVGGREAYDAFWGDVASVAIADVTATGPDSAQATLTYTFTDGRVVQEVTAYRLVDEGGVLKIAETTVLSSTPL